MEGEEIGLVLARASDLRSRISACAAAAGVPPPRRDAGPGEAMRRLGGASPAGDDEEADAEEEEEEVESLVGISDALESLERQLAALQDLQHQQRYERETILSQIDRSRRSLLSKLKEYKGQDCEVIHEAAAFAGEKIEHDDGLVLPPYSNHVINSFVLDDVYPLSYASKPKRSHNGLGSDGMATHEGARVNGLDNRNAGSRSRGGIGSFIGWVAKTAVMVVGAVSIMKAAGYEPVIGANSIRLDIAGLFGKQAAGDGEEQQSARGCPPGKVMVFEGGRAHCVVKERVEVPFDTNLASPNVSYGLG
ncbi:hypothetical protein U9M48_011553 [Paspalum notatum var. saurae]|uniref:Plastid division protein PDV2 n=1 Tax=Paspalum notatum var. saurae TaxID=547442 RepID=A0AAQ3SVN4_PASNO